MNILKNVKTVSTKGFSPINDSNFIIGKDETLNPKYTRIFGITYAVNVYYLRINSPELNLEKNNININLPMNLRNKNNQTLLDTILYKMYLKIAENEIENILEKARHTFGFAPEDYEFKKVTNTLAYCNKATQTLIINPQLMMYSKDLIEYVIYHQFCHLKYKTHSQKFYEMLKQYKPNYEYLAKQMPNFKY